MLAFYVTEYVKIFEPQTTKPFAVRSEGFAQTAFSEEAEAPWLS